MGKTKIKIDLSICGYEEGTKVDPRECRKCLLICDPAVFLMHPTLEEHPDPYNPEKWKITPVWPSMCTGCMRCVEACPEGAIEVKPGRSLLSMLLPGL